MEANFGEGGFRNTALALQVRGTYKTRRTLQYMNKLGSPGTQFHCIQT